MAWGAAERPEAVVLWAARERWMAEQAATRVVVVGAEVSQQAFLVDKLGAEERLAEAVAKEEVVVVAAAAAEAARVVEV